MKVTAILLLLFGATITLQKENPCKLPADTGACKGSFPRYYYDWNSKQCRQFTYGGCQGNANNYASLEECKATCPGEEQNDEDPCELPAVRGRCKAYIVVFYYNKESKKCDKFAYGGCEGNGNRFTTQEQCEAKCVGQKKEENPCKLPAETGPCKASLTRYHYAWDLKKCVAFTYGGCKGNSNNFESIAECEEKCGKKEKDENPCELPAETGPRMASFIRFYYDKQSKQCKTFTYGGRQGNANNFESLQECEARCVDQNKKEENPCKLRADPGPCKAVFIRYYYNWDWKECMKFTYGGCEGNANNFESIAQCEATCADKKKKDNPCDLPAEPGPCRASFIRYYYNKQSKKCETFVYGGCEGNENSFETLEDCEARCIEHKKTEKNPCDLPADAGPCKASIPRYYYNKNSKKCDTFVYGGCHGNENNFGSLEECQAKCAEQKKQENPCMLPADSGPCKASFTKYYYDWDLKKCVTFTYGGCQGNANNFESAAECEATCAERKNSDKGPCELPADTGPCDGSLIRFYYNKDAGKCKTFKYGGCLGNQNNFESLQNCEAKCAGQKKTQQSPCELPAETGPCMASFIRFYYNKASKKCETFTYGGCQGNENNFESLQECEAKCAEQKKEENPCKLRADAGPCKAIFVRYYYNWDWKECLKFTYGGCEGNANNFESIAQCEATCADKKKKDNPCDLPAEPGPCMASFIRYYYNKESKKCETFTYGGCEGNENSFETLKDCEARCVKQKKRKREESPCKLPADIGPCKMSIVRYYYNNGSKKCEQFTYGGCHGNENNFESMEKCEATCPGQKRKKKQGKLV
ncbi:hypothetical protein M514_13698 [Trichuris suis]|uniref:BPTI/Kunitz inhibitor domain-containing protein n=1 Tax=Trichuris suis TaxID=68888 RepID=A0A085LKD1_9BILA|nr:hypothetical protein M513_13698 [Trichuris suis]KFD69066.1 hypothetical protein M514_13698 [Trichuris suis]